MLPPTGADFAFRSFQLPLAILAGIVILLVALLVVRRELCGAAVSELAAARPAPAVDAMPGRRRSRSRHPPGAGAPVPRRRPNHGRRLDFEP